MYNKKSGVAMPKSRPLMGNKNMNNEGMGLDETAFMATPIKKPTKKLAKAYNGFTGNYSTD
tara:strand:- start:634 stop:816 length:183 start_codon:yes stop_codon:yes gene_type:complete